jgi:hypothetical protein
MFKVALDATGLPGRKKPWEEVTQGLQSAGVAAGVPQAQLPWLSTLSKLYYSDMTAVQKTHMALTQWEETRTLHADAELLTDALATAEPARMPVLLGHFDLPRYRAAAYPISHLHLTF